MNEPVDHVYDWIWQLSDMKGIIPPFCIELSLMDGSRYYLHSVPVRDPKTLSLVLRVWDFRAFSSDEIEQFKQKLNISCSRDEDYTEKDYHPKLDYADLRLHLQNINYAIEWNDKVWPREQRPKMGFLD